MMTLREEIMKSAGVLDEGLFDKLKLKKLTAQREKLIQQAQAEQDPQKRQALNQQAIDLGNQIRKLQIGSATGKLDKQMASYTAEETENVDVLDEGLFDKLKLKKMKAQLNKLIQQGQIEKDSQKKMEIVKQIQELRSQIQKLELGPMDKKMAPYMAQAQSQPQAAKKHEGCCPQCGKKFSKCTCK